MKTIRFALCVCVAVAVAACRETGPVTAARVSGQADATEVQVAPEVGGRIVEMTIAEGDRVKQGDIVARLDTRDVDLALQRAHAERSQVDAQLRLLQAGARGEDIRQAEAQVAGASADVAAAQSDLAAAETDLQRFEKLLASKAVCVFTEPQHDASVARALVEGTPARLGQLDDLGDGIEPGADAYFVLLRNLAQAVRKCLAPG